MALKSLLLCSMGTYRVALKFAAAISPERHEQQRAFHSLGSNAVPCSVVWPPYLGGPWRLFERASTAALRDYITRVLWQLSVFSLSPATRNQRLHHYR
jgi:hypothetical protein